MPHLPVMIQQMRPQARFGCCCFVFFMVIFLVTLVAQFDDKEKLYRSDMVYKMVTISGGLLGRLLVHEPDKI
ncbi:MAG: hypothetical protein RIR59_1578 [Pseudomonadota bacterium]